MKPKPPQGGNRANQSPNNHQSQYHSAIKSISTNLGKIHFDTFGRVHEPHHDSGHWFVSRARDQVADFPLCDSRPDQTEIPFWVIFKLNYWSNVIIGSYCKSALIIIIEIQWKRVIDAREFRDMCSAARFLRCARLFALRAARLSYGCLASTWNLKWLPRRVQWK